MHEMDAATIAIPLLLFAIWYLDENRLAMFIPFAVLVAASKEQMGLLVACLGVWFALRTRRYLAGGLILVCGAAWSAIAFAVIIPYFSGGASPYGARYEDVGGSPTGIAKTLVTDPVAILSEATTSADLAFVARLAAPLLGLCLLAPGLLVAAAPQLAVNLLSDRPVDVTIGSQTASPIIPFVFAAAVVGAARLGRHREKVLAGVVVMTGLAIFAGPLEHISTYGARKVYPPAHVAAAQRAVGMIPPDAPVSATNDLGAHLSARRRFYSFPVVRPANWVAVDLRDPKLPVTRPGQPRHGLAVGIFDLTFQPKRLRAEVRGLRRNLRWELVFEQNDILVFRRKQAQST